MRSARSPKSGCAAPQANWPTASAKLMVTIPRPVDVLSGETNRPIVWRRPTVTAMIAAEASTIVQKTLFALMRRTLAEATGSSIAALFPRQAAVRAFPAQQLEEVPGLEEGPAAARAGEARDPQARDPDRAHEREREGRQKETWPPHAVEQQGKQEYSRHAGSEHPPQEPRAAPQAAPGLVGRHGTLAPAPELRARSRRRLGRAVAEIDPPLGHGVRR